MIRACSFALLCVCVLSLRAQEWHYVGNEGFSTQHGEFWYATMAISRDTPYVAYSDYTNGLKCSMMKFNGSQWVYVGNPGFSADTAFQNTVAFDTNGSPYVSYVDFGNGRKVTVMKFNGSEWAPVGTPGFSPGSVDFPSIAINNNNTIYVAYEDLNDIHDDASVMKFNGTEWVNVGVPDFSMGSVEHTQIALNKIGTPYVIFNSGGILIMTYNGISWEVLGRAASDNNVDYNAMAIDDSGHIHILLVLRGTNIC